MRAVPDRRSTWARVLEPIRTELLIRQWFISGRWHLLAGHCRSSRGVHVQAAHGQTGMDKAPRQESAVENRALAAPALLTSSDEATVAALWASGPAAQRFNGRVVR